MESPTVPQRLLCLETGFPTYSIALLEIDAGGPPSVVSEYLSAESRKASTYLHGDIRDTLDGCGWGVDDLTGVCVSTGPGGFTGLRVGTAAAKGLARVADLPLYAGNALAALTVGLALGEATSVIPAIDVRRGEVTLAVWKVESGKLGAVLLEERTGTPTDLMEAVGQQAGARPLLLGTGVGLHEAKFRERLGESAKIWSVPAYPTAGAVGRSLLDETGRFWANPTPLEELRPQYARSEGREFKKSSDKPRIG